MGAIIAVLAMLLNEMDRDGQEKGFLDDGIDLPLLPDWVFASILFGMWVGSYFLFKAIIGWKVAAITTGVFGLLIGWMIWDTYGIIDWKRLARQGLTVLKWIAYALIISILIH